MTAVAPRQGPVPRGIIALLDSTMKPARQQLGEFTARANTAPVIEPASASGSSAGGNAPPALGSKIDIRV